MEGVSWLERIVEAEEARMLDNAKVQARLKVDIQRSKRLHADLKARELLLLEEINLLGESIATRKGERKRLAGEAASAAAATNSASSEASKKRPRITPLPGEAGQAGKQAREGEVPGAGWTVDREPEAETLLEELEAKKKRAMGVGQSDVVVYDTESEANENDDDDDDDDDDDGREMSAAEIEDVLLRMMNKDEAEEKTREMLDAEPGDANCTIVEAVLVRRSSATEGKPAKPAASGIRFREISPRCPFLPFSCTLSCNTTPPLPDFKRVGHPRGRDHFLARPRSINPPSFNQPSSPRVLKSGTPKRSRPCPHRILRCCTPFFDPLVREEG